MKDSTTPSKKEILSQHRTYRHYEGKDARLTLEQEKLIEDLVSNGVTDLREIVEKVWIAKDIKLTEWRAIAVKEVARSYGCELRAETPVRRKVTIVNPLTEEQKKNISRLFDDGKKPHQIALIIYNQEYLSKNSKELKRVREFCELLEHNKDNPVKESIISTKIPEDLPKLELEGDIEEEKPKLSQKLQAKYDEFLQEEEKDGENEVEGDVEEGGEDGEPTLEETKESPDRLKIEADRPPKSVQSTVGRVEKATGIKFDRSQINSKQRELFAQLHRNLNLAYYQSQLKSHTSAKYRQAFEHEFIRLSWDKAELTAEDTNLIIDVCLAQNRKTMTMKRYEVLSNMYEEVDDISDLKQGFSEHLNAAQTELKNLDVQLQKSRDSLQSSRKERENKRSNSNANILVLVDEVKSYEGRQRIAQMLQRQREFVKSDAKKVEEFSDYYMSIYGVSREELF